MKKKSRVNWLEAGDQNTSYFHRVVKAKAAKSRILSILLPEIEEPALIKKEFLQHFQNFLGTADSNG
jgi:hypothetical protein